MSFLKRDGVSLAFEDSKTGRRPIVFVHGCSLDSSTFKPQVEYFRASHRVVTVDLRGHGKSDAPRQDYTMPDYAEDLAWLCKRLGLVQPVVVGHSMGGNVGLELAARYPDVVSALVMIDAALLSPLPPVLFDLEKTLQTPEYLSAWRQALLGLCLPTDRHGPEIIAALVIPQHVLTSAWPNHVTRYDAAEAAALCRVPVAYLHAAMPFVDLVNFQALTPQLVTAHTLGSGHFAMLEVPDQINAMIAAFLEKYEKTQGDSWKLSAPQA